MRHRTITVVAPVLLVSALAVSACGGSSGSSSDSGSDTTTASGDGAPAVSDDVAGVIGTLLEAASGSRGDKVDLPGKVRFFDILQIGGKPVDVDVWWGRPDEQQKAATVKFGEASAYLTPKGTKGFDSAVYTVTEVGTGKELWSWDRFSPAADTQRTVVFMPTQDGTALSETDIDEQLTAKDMDGNPSFPVSDAGRMRMYWREVGDAIQEGNDLLSVTDGTVCYTNGSGIEAPDAAKAVGNTFEVAQGTTLGLVPYGQCGTAGVGSVKVPADAGRGILFAARDAAGKPQLMILPVEG